MQSAEKPMLGQIIPYHWEVLSLKGGKIEISSRTTTGTDDTSQAPFVNVWIMIEGQKYNKLEVQKPNKTAQPSIYNYLQCAETTSSKPKCQKGLLTWVVKTEIQFIQPPCAQPTVQTGYPATQKVQIRQKMLTLQPPVWLMNGGCDQADPQIIQYTDAASGNSLTASALGIIVNGYAVEIKTTAAMKGTADFKIRYSQKVWDSRDTATKFTMHSEVVVSYVDECSDAAMISILPYRAFADMVTSVLKSTSESAITGVPDLVQNFAKEAEVQYNIPWLASSELVQTSCGQIKTELENLSVKEAEFITSKFDWSTNDQNDRYVQLAPSKSEHVGSYTVRIKHYLVEHPNIVKYADLQITVEPCKIVGVNDRLSDTYDTPYVYTLYQQAKLEVQARKYDFSPLCPYTEAFTIDVNPKPTDGQEAFYKVDSSTGKVTFESRNQQNDGTYTVTLSSTIPGYRADYPAFDTTRSFLVQVKDPCKATSIVPKFSSTDLHFLLGQAEKQFVFKDYQDQISLTYDPSGDPHAGYLLCQQREYQIKEKVAQGSSTVLFATGKGTDRTYITHRKVDSTKEVEVTYGSQDERLAGSHLFQVNAWLTNYPAIKNEAVQLNVTFYKQEADLKIANAEYTINQAALTVTLPRLQTSPPLHESFNEETGENGAEILYEAFLLVGGSLTPLPTNLATLDIVEKKITFDSKETSYIGLRTARVTYTFQDYLRGSQLYSDFSVQVLPEPLDDLVSVKLRPTFFLDDRKPLTYLVAMGSAWTLKLPEGRHQEPETDFFYREPELGKAAVFMSYEQQQRTLNIAANATSEIFLGDYPIRLRLIDVFGVQSEELTITVRIVTPSSSQNETQEDDQAAIDTSASNQGAPAYDNDAIGELFAELLKRRAERQSEEKQERGPRVAPTVKISNIDSNGLVTVSFSKPMVVFKELLGMNQDGIKLNTTRQLQDEEEQQVEVNQQAEVKRAKLEIFDIRVQPGEMTEIADVKHSWEVTDFTSTELAIRLTFDIPVAVSTSGSEADSIEINFNGEQIFNDEKDALPIEQNTKLTHYLPRQFPDEASRKRMEVAKTVVMSGTSAIFASNLAASLPTTISLEYLWEMINAQQIVVMLPLLQVQIPMNAYIIFEQLMKIAAFEVIPTEMIYKQVSDLEGETFSETFEELGFEHHLILNNFGTLGFIATLGFCLYLLNSMLSRCECEGKHYTKCQKKVNRFLYWGFVLRLILESYIIGFICSLINLSSLDLSTDADRWTRTNSYVTLFVFALLILFPFWGAYLMLTRFEVLHDRNMVLKYSEMHEGYSKKHRTMVIYWVLDLVRKAVLCVAMVSARNHLWLQMLVVFMTSVMLIIAASYTNARERAYDRRMDIFNEVKLIFLMYHMVLFTAFVPDAQTKYFIGYSCCVNIVGGIVINMTMMVLIPAKHFQHKCRIKYYYRKNKKQLAKTRKVMRFSAKEFHKRRALYYDQMFAQAQQHIEQIRQERHERRRLRQEARRQELSESRVGFSVEQLRDKAFSSNELLESPYGKQKRPEDIMSRNVLQGRRPKLLVDSRQPHQQSSVLTMIKETKEEASIDYDSMQQEGRVLEEDDEYSSSSSSSSSLTSSQGSLGSDQSFHEPARLNMDDISYLWIEHGIGFSQIMDVPGYENFEVTDTVPVDFKDRQAIIEAHIKIEESTSPHQELGSSKMIATGARAHVEQPDTFGLLRKNNLANPGSRMVNSKVFPMRQLDEIIEEKLVQDSQLRQMSHIPRPMQRDLSAESCIELQEFREERRNRDPDEDYSSYFYELQ